MLFFLFPTLIVIPLGIYMYFAAKRGVTLFLHEGKRTLTVILSFAVSAVLVLPIYGVFGIFSSWSIVVLHIVLLTMLTQGINFIAKKVSKGKLPKAWEYIYRLAVIPILLSALLMTYGYFNMKEIVRTEYTVKTDKNINKNCRIALLADIHFGTALDGDDIAELVGRVNKEQADIVILCGDLLDEKTTYSQMKELFLQLSKLKTKEGTYFVYGNHDRSVYSQNPNYTEQQLAKAISDSGIELLCDRAVRLDSDIVLVGRKDKSMKGMGIDELTSEMSSDSFILLADHQPTEFDKKAEAGIDLQLSGHTHGGQIFPIGYLNTLISSNDLCYGMKEHKGMTAVVTSGVSGWGFSVRTQGVSEYVVINVVKQ